ncbi:MAG: TlpA disulfide reductase family protein [Burkholderiaceae bacterium]|nr:TlpA disulfide reductase family protein [Burkholderiaceae bacterium]
MTPPSDKPNNAQRRHLLTAGVAALAVGAGIAGAWWQSKNDSSPPSDQSPTAAGDLSDLWSQTFDTPTGGKLVMQALRGKPVLINFWATWCPPCVEELPLLERFYSQNKANGVQIVGLAADKPEAVHTFLQKMPLTFPIGLVGMSGIALSKSWGNLVGGLPFSVMLAADGHVMQRKMGKLSESDLRLWAGLS